MSTMTDARRLASLRSRLDPLRTTLLNHPVYGQIQTLPRLRQFMEHHVFAVWDFMSLLKALQRRICCVSVPWRPRENAEFARLINEIVLGEESDLDSSGAPASHFELYLRSMQQCGADVAPIGRLVDSLRGPEELSTSLWTCGAPPAAARFVESTFAVIQSDDLASIASAFTFGREDLLPDVFRQIVLTLDRQTGGELTEFRYYLDRHIEVDGGEHGPMSERLIAGICAEDSRRWERVEAAAVKSLEERIRLWDSVSESFREAHRATA